MRWLFELMAQMLIVGLVAAGLVLIALAIAAAVVGALLWLFLAAAHDRAVARGSRIGYWRWWGDRYQHLLVAWDQGRNGAVLGEAVRRRTIVRLEAQSERLARRLRDEKVGTGVVSGWARRQDEQRLEELHGRLEAEREAVFGRPAPPKPHHRVADHNREETVTALSRAHWEGRLDAAELEQRIGDAYTASTYAELEALVTDIGARRAASGQKRRVSDPEREGAVRVLRAALEEGRLSPDEFSARAERAYVARFAEEIAGLVGDLPDSYALRAHLPPEGGRTTATS